MNILHGYKLVRLHYKNFVLDDRFSSGLALSRRVQVSPVEFPASTRAPALSQDDSRSRLTPSHDQVLATREMFRALSLSLALSLSRSFSISLFLSRIAHVHINIFLKPPLHHRKLKKTNSPSTRVLLVSAFPRAHVSLVQRRFASMLIALAMCLLRVLLNASFSPLLLLRVNVMSYVIRCGLPPTEARRGSYSTLQYGSVKTSGFLNV